MIRGSVILTKVDKEGNTLEGAVFSVRDRNNKRIPGYTKLTTNGNGQIEAKNLLPGEYQFVEEKAPEHYEIDKNRLNLQLKRANRKHLLLQRQITSLKVVSL